MKDEDKKNILETISELNNTDDEEIEKIAEAAFIANETIKATEEMIKFASKVPPQAMPLLGLYAHLKANEVQRKVDDRRASRKIWKEFWNFIKSGKVPNE